MMSGTIMKNSLLALAIVLVLSCPFSQGICDVGVELLPGGPEVIYQPHPESAVVCLTVAVAAGSVYESPETRGVTHFLEHLCFDGTERFTREEMSGWVDDVGGFLNAFTRKETTVYFMLVDRGYLEHAIEILSQMLLHSVFPSGELEKERKIVLEEIRHTMDSPAQERSRYVDRYLYRGSDLIEPILGYPSTIAEISREQIIEYYRQAYTPSRMRIILTGGFDRLQARGWIRDYFITGKGHAAAGREDGYVLAREKKSQPGKKVKAAGKYISTPRWSREITSRSSREFKTGFEILVPVPGVDDKGFSAVLLIEEILGSDDSPLAEKLERLSLPPADVYLEVHRGFSALRFQFDSLADIENGQSKVIELIKELSSWKPSRKVVEDARTSFLSSDALSREKYHFYIMLEGERIAMFGEKYLFASNEGVRNTGQEDIRKVFSGYFKPLYFNAVSIDDRPVRRVSAGGVSKLVSRTLDNGCVIASSKRSGSDIAAVHILVRGRSCLDDEFFPGITVVLNAVLENSKEGKKLSARLRSIGASVQWADNPYIPMDDYYLNHSWSFIRLQAPADRIGEAAELLARHLSDSGITDEDLSSVAMGLRRELMVRSGSAQGRLTSVMRKRLFGEHIYSRSVFPGMSRLAEVSVEDLTRFRRRSLCGSNIIVTMVSPLEPGEALDMLEGIFFNLRTGERVECPVVTDTVVAGMYEESIDKSGAYLAAGWLIADPSAAETAAVIVASEILSRRMQLEIREVQGLAYSTGCYARYHQGAVSVMASVGTRKENLDKATKALKNEITSLSEKPATVEETGIAKNRLLSRLARRELSSINEAFSMGLDLFFGGGERWSTLIESVSDRDVEAVISGLFLGEKMVFVRMIPEDGIEKKKAMPMRMMK